MKLLPKQQKVLETIQQNYENASIFIVRGETGSGKTTILEELSNILNAKIITIREILEEELEFHPFKWEEALYSYLIRLFKKETVLLLDDIDLIYRMNKSRSSIRYGASKAVFEAIGKMISLFDKKLITTVSDILPEEISREACIVKLPAMEPEDLEILLRYNIEITKQIDLDVERVIRYAPGLSSHKVAMIAKLFNNESIIYTEKMIEAIENFCLSTVLPYAKLNPLKADSLIGLDYALDILNQKVIEPIMSYLAPPEKLSLDTEHKYLENIEKDNPESESKNVKKAAAVKKDLTPEKKTPSSPPHKGILLSGPEGSGKTAIGRILAGVFPGRFVFFDGNTVNDSDSITEKIKELVSIALQVAPSILFLDDLDPFLNQNSKSFSPNLATYFKSLFDGVQKKLNLPISIILTTTNSSNLPNYLIRTGRFDLRIELKLPDEKLRTEIFKKSFASIGLNLETNLLIHLAEETETFSVSDCQRLAREVHEYLDIHKREEIDIVDLITKKVILLKSP